LICGNSFGITVPIVSQYSGFYLSVKDIVSRYLRIRVVIAEECDMIDVRCKRFFFYFMPSPSDWWRGAAKRDEVRKNHAVTRID